MRFGRAGRGPGFVWVGLLVLVFGVGLVVPSWPFGDDGAGAQEAQPEAAAPVCRSGFVFDSGSSLCERS